MSLNSSFSKKTLFISLLIISVFAIAYGTNLLSSETLVFSGSGNITRYLSLPKSANVTVATLQITLTNATTVTGFGDGSDGALEFTTTTKTYGNLVNGTDYNITGNILYLNLNRTYQFTNFTLGAGTTLKANNGTVGVVIAIMSQDQLNIFGTVSLTSDLAGNGTISQNATWSYGTDTLSFAGVNYTSSKSSTLGFGAGGKGGDCNTGSYSGTGGAGAVGGASPGGSVAGPNCGINSGSNGNAGNADSGGGSGACGRENNANRAIGGTGAAAYAGGGGSGDINGSVGDVCAGGGGGAGGSAGKSGIHFYAYTKNLNFTGAIDTSGTAGGNLSNDPVWNGGSGWAYPLGYAYGGAGGTGGSGGNAGNIKLTYSSSYSGAGTNITKGGARGEAGWGGNGRLDGTTNAAYRGAFGYNGSAGYEGTINITATAAYTSLPVYLDVNGVRAWNDTSYTWGTTVTASNFSTPIMSYLSSCAADVSGYCQVPFVFFSNASLNLEYSNRVTTFTIPNPLRVNSTDTTLITNTTISISSLYNIIVNDTIDVTYCNFTMNNSNKTVINNQPMTINNVTNGLLVNCTLNQIIGRGNTSYGNWTLFYKFGNIYSNSNFTNYAFINDTQNPTVSISAPTGTVSTLLNIPTSITKNDDLSNETDGMLCSYWVNRSTGVAEYPAAGAAKLWYDCTTNPTFNVFTDGNYVVYAEVYDGFGKQSNMAFSNFTVDTTAPAAPSGGGGGYIAPAVVSYGGAENFTVVPRSINTIGIYWGFQQPLQILNIPDTPFRSTRILKSCVVSEPFICTIGESDTKAYLQVKIISDSFFRQKFATNVRITSQQDEVRDIPVVIDVYNAAFYQPLTPAPTTMSSDATQYFFKITNGQLVGIRLGWIVLIFSVLIIIVVMYMLVTSEKRRY